MKRIIALSVLCILIFISLSAQSFKVSSIGLRNDKDSTKTYVVIEVDSLSAKTLYENMVKYIDYTYKSPKDVLSGSRVGEFISFKTHVPSLFSTNIMGYNRVFDLDYISQLYFKDGKIKFDVVDLRMHMGSWDFNFIDSGIMTTAYMAGIYTKKGDIKRPEVKAKIESYFNNIILEIKKFASGKTADNNW